MKTFTDTAGRTWTVSLNLGTAMAVNDKLGMDLIQPEAGAPPLLTRLGTDEFLLGEVICCLLAGRFEVHKVTAAMGGAGRRYCVHSSPTPTAARKGAGHSRSPTSTP